MLIGRTQVTYNLRIIIGIVIAFLLIGCVFIYSSSSIYALSVFKSAHYFVKKQLIGIILGIIALVVLRLIPISWIKSWCPFAFWSSLILTALTQIKPFAVHIHGSSRWLNLGGFVFQPSELLKMTFIIYLAYLLAKREYQLTSFSRSYFPLLIIIGTTSLILLKQPDFGLTLTLVITAFCMMQVIQVPSRYIITTILCLIPLAVGLIFMRSYRLQRILTFLNPWADPQGSGFQMIQSLIAIGSGSFWGTGISHSRQKFFYLPMQHTDFIFSIIAEELGFFGSVVIISLYAVFTYCGLRIARNLNDTFSALVVLGFTLLISLQALINFAVTTGLAPTKGIGLPFVSYGNTSLVCSLSMIGIVMNVVYNHTTRSSSL